MGIHTTWMSVVDPRKGGKKTSPPHTHEKFFCALNLCARPVYPKVHVLLQLLVKSTARCLKTRLEAVVLMQAHRQQVTELATNDIIDKFAACGDRKSVV